MKRWTLLPLALVVAFVATACPPPGPAGPYVPPGWQRAVIQPLTLDFETVEAGGTFSFTVRGSDDIWVDRYQYRIADPSGGGSYPCDESGFVPGPEVEFTVTCTLPGIAPNGTWWAHAGISDGQLTGLYPWTVVPFDSTKASFEVTGGSDDIHRPVVESFTRTPDPAVEPIVVGQPFTLTLIASDAHWSPTHHPVKASIQDLRSYPYGPVVEPYGPQFTFCAEVSSKLIAPTRYRWVLECPTAALRVGVKYRLSGIGSIADALGHPLDDGGLVDEVDFVPVAPA